MKHLFGKRSRQTIALGASLVALAASGFAAANGLTLESGVFTEEQANKGKETYENSCKNCHTPDFYKDKLLIWQGQPVVGFFDIISTTMPADNPASLMFDDYVNVLAYIFAEIGYPAGDKPLDPYDGSMEEIKIVAPK